MKSIRVLIGCEVSGIVREAFRARGFDAWSCDILPTEIPGNHIICEGPEDIFRIAAGNWDLGIFHPPCRYSANSGVWALYNNDGSINIERWKLMREGAQFFKRCLDLPIKRKALENPVLHKYAIGIIGCRQSQTIQPYQFGHPESKRTGLWLIDLPKLVPVNILEKPACGYWQNQTPTGQNKLGPNINNRAAIRSKTYSGIAAAMAEQWGTFLFNQTKKKHYEFNK